MSGFLVHSQTSSCPGRFRGGQTGIAWLVAPPAVPLSQFLEGALPGGPALMQELVPRRLKQSSPADAMVALLCAGMSTPRAVCAITVPDVLG